MDGCRSWELEQNNNRPRRKRQNAPRRTTETSEQIELNAEEAERRKCIQKQNDREQKISPNNAKKRRPRQRRSARETVTDLHDNERQGGTPREVAEPEELTAGNEEGGKCLTGQ